MAQNDDFSLELENISKSFASVKVLKNVSFTLRKGSILGLVGENGAGKSTLMNILSGVYSLDSGEIRLFGKPFHPQNPKDSLEAGIAFIQQELNLFTNLSIMENLFITNMPRTGILKSVDYKKMKKTVQEKLDELEISDLKPETIVGTLPMGQRQLIEIAKALISDAKVIIFDEPTTSLSDVEKLKLFKIMKNLKEKGKSIIFVSHILEDIFQYCDEIMVMRNGEVISQDKTEKFTENDVVRMMVGRELNNIYPTVEKTIGNVVFESKNICQTGRFSDVSLHISEGEIVGFFGLMGAGRTEYLRCLFGVDPIDSGSIVYKGTQISPITPENCIRNGMAFITENRREEGLLLPKTVKENSTLANLNAISKNPCGFINFNRENQMCTEVTQKLSIKTFDPSRQIALNLSGGNQQKLVFGKWVLCQPKVFLLDEPTRGVDVGAKYEIYNIINDLAKNNSAILMVSSDMEELLGLCDRIIVMSHFKISGEFMKNDFSQEDIMTAAIEG